MQTSTQGRWPSPFHPANRIRPIVALRAVCSLIRNPESAGEASKVIDVLKGGSLEQAVERMAASAQGWDLLQRMPFIIQHLSDREAHAAMP